MKEHEISKLARALTNELDAASIEKGLLNPRDIIPFDQQPPRVQEAITMAAEKLYARLAYHSGGGYIVVDPGGPQAVEL